MLMDTCDDRSATGRRSDPNASAVLAERREEVRRAAGSLIDDRCRFLSDRIRGLDVLDVGCVNHSAETRTQDGWLHGHLARSARSCLGVDILERDVALLQEQGFHVKVWDVTASPLPQTYDAIVCGELIEHVGNPAGLFTNCRLMLRPEGRLYVTTPNPWFVNYLLKALLSRAPIIENADHVAWFEPCVLAELAKRNGLRLMSFAGIRVTHTNTWKAALFFRLFPLARALGFRKELFAKSIIYEFGLK